MLIASVVHTRLDDPSAAGQALGAEINAAFEGGPPDVVILFAAGCYAYEPLLAALARSSGAVLLIGCSTAGELSAGGATEGSATALAMRSPDMTFVAGIGRDLRADRAGAARDLARALGGAGEHQYPFRTALVLTDALAGHASDLLDGLTLLTAGTYQFIGGGAGDDARFSRTHVFYGTEAVADAAVVLGILSHVPVGIGASHGWEPASPFLRVTAADGLRLHSLNACSAIEVFEEYASMTGQPLDRLNPMPFFLHNLLGVECAEGQSLRMPLSLQADGSVEMAADIPVGALVRFMRSTPEHSIVAGARAAGMALAQLEGRKPHVALVFDCVATRLRLGLAFDDEVRQIAAAVAPAQCIGCNTYGQFVRATGQFNGFHNATAVVCVFPT